MNSIAQAISRQIGEFFRARRLASGIDAETVAKCLSLPSAQALEDYEAGRSEILLPHIFELSNLYDVSPDEIVVLFYDLAHARAQLADAVGE